MFIIIFDVGIEFLDPKFSICGWSCAVLTTLMSMPEASVDEDHSPVLGQYNVRFPRQPPFIDTIAEPMTPQRMTQFYLRFCGSGVYSDHVFMPLTRGKDISHNNTATIIQIN